MKSEKTPPPEDNEKPTEASSPRLVTAKNIEVDTGARLAGGRRRMTTSALGIFKTVLGKEDRRKKVLIQGEPWNKICALYILGTNNSEIRGTGWLIAPRVVITAGHNVFSQKNLGGWAREVVATASLDGGYRPYGERRAAGFDAHPDWIANGGPDADVGCIYLDKPFDLKIGEKYFYPVASEPSTLLGRRIKVLGYPTDLKMARVQYEHEGEARHLHGTSIYYDVDTHGGQSGAPIFVKEGDSFACDVAGLHAYGDYNGSPYPITNSGPIFTSAIVNLLQDWRDRGNR